MSDDRTTLDAGLPDGATVGKVALEQSVAVIRPVAGVQISPMTQAQRDLNVLMDEIDRLRAQRDEGSATAYQRWTAETAIGGYPEAGTGSRTAINYAVIGLNDEAGEVAGKWKKLLRGDDVNDEARQARITALQDEVGDVLWYAARIAEETGTTLDALMARNRAKLMDRKRRGVIKGDGDRR